MVIDSAADPTPDFSKKLKGKHLERAVACIEEAIINNNPFLKNAPFTIETNKILQVHGVKMEIDVLVETLPDSTYKSKVIFECKNWKDPVDKNAVIILSDKVNALGANFGFLVAPAITKSAKARLLQDSRLKFLRSSSDLVGPLQSAELVHTIHDPIARSLHVRLRDVEPLSHPVLFDYKEAICVFHDQPADLTSMIEGWFDKWAHDDKRKRAYVYSHAGTHPISCDERITFHPGEFKLNGLDVEYVVIRATYFVICSKPRIVSRFEFEGRGRVVSFEPFSASDDGETVTIDLVQRI
jgi:hypothetical protein